MRALRVLVLLIASALGTVGAASASPPTNGPIVFQSNRAGGASELFVQNEEATDVRRLTFNSATDRVPRFSRDGEWIAFSSDRDGNLEIYVMRKDGSDVRRITHDPARDDVPVFTADGSRLVWQRGPFFCPCTIWTAAVDGSDQHQVDTGVANSAFPDMSPNGSTLTFTELGGSTAIFTVQLNGRALKQVTFPPPGSGDFRSRWSPSGNDLVFQRDDGTNLNDVYTVHRDGTELTQLTSGPRFEEQSQFSPDGKRVIFAVFAPDGGARLHTIRRDGTGDAPLPQQGSPFIETFEGDALEPWRFWIELAGPGSSVTVTGGRAELALAADAANDPGRGWMGPHFGTQCRAIGDYTASFAFSLFEWPAANGTHILLGDGGVVGSIARRSEFFAEGYLAFFNPLIAEAPSADLVGALRLERGGSALTGSYAAGSAWVPLLSGPASSDAITSVAHLFSTDAAFADQPVRVAVDDFVVTAEAFACPSWWRDAGPDWAAAH